MVKRIVLGALLVGFVGVLVVGAINRTNARTGDAEGTQSQRRGWSSAQAAPVESGRSAQGLESSGQGGARRGGNGGQGRGSSSGDQTGTGEAQVSEWLQIEGIVAGANAEGLVVQTDGGQQVIVENRPWLFAQEQGFSAQTGDQVTLTGFYEGDAFEVGQIEDATNGQTVVLRDVSGRPMWAGRGRSGA